jgi:hypothetical protein
MVNSGVRVTKDWDPRNEAGCTSVVPVICPIIFKCRYLVPVICSIDTPGGVVASGSSLVLPRAAAVEIEL